MNVNRDIVPIWWVWLHDLDIPWHQRNHFKVRMFVTNHETCLKYSPFLIQFSPILLGHLFIDTNLMSLWLSGLLTLGNLLNTWLSPVSTLSSAQTRHGHEWCLVTILWQSCDNLVTLAPRPSWVCGAAKYPIGPTWHDSWHSWHHRVTVSCATRHGDGWLTNMRCLWKFCMHHKN